MWAPRYRVLVVFTAIALCFGVREYLIARSGELGGRMSACEASAASCFSIPANIGPMDDLAFWSRHSGITQVLTQLDPDHPDADVLRAMEALQRGDTAAFSEDLERALSTGIKHNSFLLKSYAQLLLSRGADWRVVNLAFNRWHENHPFSGEEISLQMASGPRDQAEAATLERELARVDWISSARLERSTAGGSESWLAWLSPRPGRPIDIRQAIAALSILSLGETERTTHQVTCQTLVDCSVMPRGVR